MVPKREWIEQWIRRREELFSAVNFERYFSPGMIGGQQLEVVRVGLCSVPSGELLVRDPACCLESREELPYFITGPVGNYPVELAFVRPDGTEPLFVAARVRFNYLTAVRFEQALIGNEELEDYNGGFFGFFSYSGLGCICDRRVHRSFCSFVEKWREQHPEGSLMEDLFGPLLDKNSHRGGNGWINWVIPGSKYQLPIFRTGWGEGQYPVYWGRDAGGDVCQLVIWMIDLDREEEPLPEGEEADMELPALEEAEGGYRCQVMLETWQGYFETDQALPVLLCSREKDVEACEKALARLIRQQYMLLDGMLLSLEDKYPIMQLEYGHPMAENAPEMPNLRDRNDFSRLLHPLRLMVDVQTGTVTGAFSCSWDSEHGLGISICGEQLMQIGTMQLVPDFVQQPKADQENTAAGSTVPPAVHKPMGRRKKKQQKKREQKRKNDNGQQL